VPETAKRLVFYVDTECLFSTKDRCSYYSSKETQAQAAKGRKQLWNRDCCPIVYVKTGRNKYSAICPTRGGVFGEQIPVTGGPSPSAVRVEVPPLKGESWAETVERAAKIGCSTKC